MTSIPQPSAETYAAAIERAESAEQLAAQRLDALAAVREAIGIPYAATVGGDEQIRTPILLHRIRHLSVFLDSVLRDKPAELAWSVAYLRERLAEHPAEGYRTWDDVRAGQAEDDNDIEPLHQWRPAQEGREPEPAEYDPGPEVDDEGGMSEYRHTGLGEEPW